MFRKFLLIFLSLMLLAAPALADKTVTMTFTGDVTLGGEGYLRERDYSFDTMAENMGYDYFLANVKQLFTEDDLTVVNLEGVLSDSKTGENKKKTYRFRAPTEFVKILTGSSVEAANIANNHTMDFGKQGYAATLETLQGAGMGAFGNETVYIYEKDGVKIAFFGLNTTAFNGKKAWAKEEIARLKSEEGVSAVVFTIHAGQEYGKHRNKLQQDFAHYIINAGADLVIMHHPHVVQGIEIYKGRAICYSLGNFCFGGNKNIRALETVIARVEMTFADDGAFLGQQLTLYPAHISGTEPQSNYQPVLVRGEAAARVMHLIQIDTDFPLEPFSEELGFARQAFIPAAWTAEAE